MESGCIEGGGNQRGWRESGIVEEGRKDSLTTEVRRFLASWMFKGVWHHRGGKEPGIIKVVGILESLRKGGVSSQRKEGVRHHKLDGSCEE